MTKKFSPTSLHPSLKASEDTVKLRRTGSFIALLLAAITFNAYGMKRSIESPQTENQPIIGRAQLPSGEWVDIVGLILNDNAPMKLLLTNFKFNELFPELRKQIIFSLSSYTTAKSLKEAAFTINSLAQVDKEINQLINDPQFCLKNIKYLAQKFKKSDETVANILQTKAAKERSVLQKNLTGLLIDPRLALTRPRSIDPRGAFMMLDFLCERGFDLNYIYSKSDDLLTTKRIPCQGMTALMLAVEDNNLALIKALLAKGADINGTNQCGRTALIIAVVKNNEDAVQLLINDPKININQQELAYDFTALDMACERNNIDIVEILLNAGADPEVHDIPAVEEEIWDLLEDAIDKKHEKESL
jgi:hypothetical protein